MASNAHSVGFTIFQANFNIIMLLWISYFVSFFIEENENSSEQLKYKIFRARSLKLPLSIYLSVDSIDICAYTEHNWLDMSCCI